MNTLTGWGITAVRNPSCDNAVRRLSCAGGVLRSSAERQVPLGVARRDEHVMGSWRGVGGQGEDRPPPVGQERLADMREEPADVCAGVRCAEVFGRHRRPRTRTRHRPARLRCRPREPVGPHAAALPDLAPAGTTVRLMMFVASMTTHSTGVECRFQWHLLYPKRGIDGCFYIHAPVVNSRTCPAAPVQTPPDPAGAPAAAPPPRVSTRTPRRNRLPPGRSVRNA